MNKEVLDFLSDLAAILTAAVAVVAYARFVLAQRGRRLALEAYLREEKLSGVDEGRRSVMHLMARLSMTEAEVLQSGFQSKLVTAVPGTDDKGGSDCVFFEYTGSDVRPKLPF